MTDWRGLAERIDKAQADPEENLRRYWTEGPGAAKIGWGSDGDFDRCRANVGKYIHDPHELAGFCSRMHHRATGAWPGHAPGESHAKSFTWRGTIPD